VFDYSSNFGLGANSWSPISSGFGSGGFGSGGGTFTGFDPGVFNLNADYGGFGSSGSSGATQAAQGIGGILGNVFGGPAGGAIASGAIGVLGGLLGGNSARSRTEAAREARRQQENLLETQVELTTGANIASKIADFNLGSLGAQRKFDIMNTPKYMNVAGRELGGRIAERGTYGSATPALAGRFSQMFYG
jgi:hypothetical protein